MSPAVKRPHFLKPAAYAASDRRLSRDQLTALITFVILALLTAFVLWLASLGPSESAPHEIWPMM